MTEPQYTVGTYGPSNLSRIQPATDTVYLGMRVHSTDYGNGTVVAVYGAMGVQVHWDKELEGTHQHTLLHDRSYIERLERL
jgi:hypothetical protein